MRAVVYSAIALALAAAGCTSAAPDLSASSEAPPLMVELARARTTDLPQSFEAGAVLRSAITANIASRVMAPIAAIHVRPGDRVRRGAVLVTLDGRESAADDERAGAAQRSAREAQRVAEAEARAAAAELHLASVTHARIRALFDKRSATPHELDQAMAALASAEAKAASADARIAAAIAAREAAVATHSATSVSVSYFRIMAPFDGVVLERFADPGSMAVPGEPLITLEDPTRRQLEAQVDEARARSIAVGQPVEYKLDDAADGSWIATRVSEIGRIDSATHGFLVKAAVAGSLAARSGSFGRLRFPGGTRQVLAVPARAVVRRGQLTMVFRIDADGGARLRAVGTGLEGNGLVEITAGLLADDLVVVHPPLGLGDGTRVVRP